GGDSGIGRSVAIAYAHEGADIVLNYLPEEEPDAQEVKGIIESLGRKIKLVPGDLKNEAFSQKLIDEAVSFFG
ncbi:SDR family oxidoreductase, partial [Leuconostoc mesenteroides]